MSKKSKALAQDQRRRMKRAAKDAQRAKYEAWTAAGENKKSKRNVLKGRRATRAANAKHQMAFCGNHGCLRCNPTSPGTNPWYAPKTSPIYGKRWSSPLWRNVEA